MHITGALRLDESPSEAPPPVAELEAGKLVARAAIQICLALGLYQEGKSTLATNEQGAELIARLYMLRQSAPDIDLAGAGKREMRRILAQNAGAAEALCQQYDLERVLDMLVSWPIGVLDQITADEQARGADIAVPCRRR
jgi:hypothetical protein